MDFFDNKVTDFLNEKPKQIKKKRHINTVENRTKLDGLITNGEKKIFSREFLARIRGIIYH